MRSLNNPSPCFETRIRFPLCFFLSTRFDVRVVVPALKKPTNVFRIVAFVETGVLGFAACWSRAFDRNAVEGRLKKLDVVRIGAAHLNAQRHAASIGEHRPFGSQFATIGRVFAGFFPLPEATWSSLRPHFANSTGCLFVCRTLGARPSTTCERRRPPSIPGSNDARCSPTQTPLALLSTGSPFAIHRKYRWRRFSSRRAAGHLYDSCDSAATTAGAAAKIHRAKAKRNASVCLPLDTPPCKEKTCDQIHSLRRHVVICSVLG